MHKKEAEKYKQDVKFSDIKMKTARSEMNKLEKRNSEFEDKINDVQEIKYDMLALCDEM